MKTELKEFLKPDRNKVITSLLLPYFFLGLGIFLYGIGVVFGVEFSKPLSEYLPAFGFLFFLSAFTQSILVYPFVCSLFAFVRSFKKGSIKEILQPKITPLLILLGLVFFNPVMATFYLKILTLFTISALYYPPMPMVQVVSISPDSPFVTSGIKPSYKIYTIEIFSLEEIIIEKYHRKIERKNYRKFRIKNTTDFFNALGNASVGEGFLVTTVDGSEYGLKKTENTTNWGIEVRDITYKRWLLP